MSKFQEILEQLCENKEEIRRKSAIVQGKKAFKDGKKFSDCPYKNKGSEKTEHYGWRAGWLEAEEDQK